MNLPSNAGDTGLVPGPGRSQMLWSNKAHVPQLLSHAQNYWSPHALEPLLGNKRSYHSEKPMH